MPTISIMDNKNDRTCFISLSSLLRYRQGFQCPLRHNNGLFGSKDTIGVEAIIAHTVDDSGVDWPAQTVTHPMTGNIRKGVGIAICLYAQHLCGAVEDSRDLSAGEGAVWIEAVVAYAVDNP